MYKILNWLFGWDYIYWQNSCDQGITRVMKMPDGTVWFYRYKTTNCIDIINYPDDVLWLTCLPEKYFKLP
jgi:hypothetical protein